MHRTAAHAYLRLVAATTRRDRRIRPTWCREFWSDDAGTRPISLITIGEYCLNHCPTKGVIKEQL